MSGTDETTEPEEEKFVTVKEWRANIFVAFIVGVGLSAAVSGFFFTPRLPVVDTSAQIARECLSSIDKWEQLVADSRNNANQWRDLYYKAMGLVEKRSVTDAPVR